MTDDRIAALERRVRALEDQLAIGQLIATYGPAVDSESAGAVGELWSADGVYDPGGVSPYVGRAAVGTSSTANGTRAISKRAALTS
jgi:hypothetical protein